MPGEGPQRAVVRPASAADAADLAAFLGRSVRLDPGAVVRLRIGGGRLAAYIRLPFGVLVSRSAAGDGTPADVSVAAAELLAALDRAALDRAALDAAALDRGAGVQPVPLPPRRDAAWRGALPPVAGWQRLDAVPAAAVRRLVRAGGEAVRNAGPAGSGPAGEKALLDHAALTVTGGERTVALPLRVLTAVWRMGFLGPNEAPGAPARRRPLAEPQVVVSAAGGWARVAATFGSAYHPVTRGIGLVLG